MAAVHTPNLIDLNAPIIDLSRCNIGEKVACFLATALQTNRSITALDLSYNNIGDEGITELGKALTHNKTLSYLNLAGNSINDDGCLAIAKGLKTNKTLRVLSLASNPIGDKGLIELSRVLADSGIGVTELVLLDTMLTHEGAVQLAQSLIANPNIVYVSLPYQIGHQLINEIQQILKRNWRILHGADSKKETKEKEKKAERKLTKLEPKPPTVKDRWTVKRRKDPLAEPRELADYTLNDWQDPVIKDTLLWMTVLDKKAKFKAPLVPLPAGSKGY
eukprot:TRINITY_DN93629_c0_g1_i1.p1 TRINITY_DN93629_c0_g1~~TRINITY_DN93629_c0_g1_i1.p1  ORF type:complete len:276 (+),score=31.85 TRINITY_DN93629_c0_g1_i1:50-877(+)